MARYIMDSILKDNNNNNNNNNNNQNQNQIIITLSDQHKSWTNSKVALSSYISVALAPH